MRLCVMSLHLVAELEHEADERELERRKLARAGIALCRAALPKAAELTDKKR